MIKMIGLCISLLLATRWCNAQVAVYVWQENLANGYTYRYRVVNNSPNAVVGLTVGYDADMNRNAITVDPIGVDYEPDDSDKNAIGLPISSAGASAPPGWQPNLIFTEEENGARLFFRLVDPASRLGKSLMMRGFQASTPAFDAAYRTGGFAVLLDNGATLTGRLAPDTVDAPIPAVTVAGGNTICASSEIVQVTVNLQGNGPWILGWSDGVTTTHSSSAGSRNVSPGASHRYEVVSVRDVNRPGVATGSAPVTVGSPQILTQPQSLTIPQRTATTLTVGLLSPDATYQWYSGVSGQTNKKVGSNSSSFTTPVLRSTASYWVRVTNRCGFSNSQTATVTVQ
jgi:hypothetical protein